MPIIQRKWGWKPDIPDHRDKEFKPLLARRLPKKVDMRAQCSPIEDQGELGSCTANALVGNLEFLMTKDGKPFHDMSRLFLYYNERVIEGSVNEDSGAMIRDGIKSLVKQGCCTENAWPYDIDLFTDKPPAACYAEALNYQVLTYRRINSLNDMLNCLAAGFPFVCGISVYESFESQAVAQTGVVPYPGRRERLLGGHAVMAVGYDSNAQKFLMRNSWGTDWGMSGYFTIDFRYLSNRNLSDDFWCVTTAEQM